MKEFTTLKIIASILKAIGIIIIALSVIMGLYALIAGNSYYEIGLFNNASSLIAVIPGIIFGTIILALSETIFLFLQIEKNTRPLLKNQKIINDSSIGQNMTIQLSEKEKSEIYKMWREKNPNKSIEEYNKYFNETFS